MPKLLKTQRLDNALVQRGLCESRTKAQGYIMAGQVFVNEQPIHKAGTLIAPDAKIRLFEKEHSFVSRGALKLLAALKYWPYPVAGKICLDVGASTGGFTEVLLVHGAQLVYALDVGHGQLAWKIRQDNRVISLEKTHIRRTQKGLLSIDPEICVIDVSFISLLKVFPFAIAHLRRPARIYTLIKPQFEVGPQFVESGGIVKDSLARQRAVSQVIASLTQDATCLGVKPSPILGTDGNQEYLAAFQI